jgi:hypothetical protein
MQRLKLVLRVWKGFDKPGPGFRCGMLAWVARRLHKNGGNCEVQSSCLDQLLTFSSLAPCDILTGTLHHSPLLGSQQCQMQGLAQGQ